MSQPALRHRFTRPFLLHVRRPLCTTRLPLCTTNRSSTTNRLSMRRRPWSITLQPSCARRRRLAGCSILLWSTKVRLSAARLPLCAILP